MKLTEAFKKYADDVKLVRNKKQYNILGEEVPRMAADIKFLKGLHAWGNEDSRKLGFIIPDFMIDDAQADDWEVLEEKHETI